MKLNNRGIAEVAILLYVIGAMFLFFVPNPVSSSLGVGVKPNKTVQKVSHTEKLVPVITVDGKEQRQCPALKTVTEDYSADDSIQQHVTFWEWLRSLPILVLLLMGLGVIFPPVALFLHNLWSKLQATTKNIVVSVDHAMDNIHDPAIKDVIKNSMAKIQDNSTKKLVDKIQGK